MFRVAEDSARAGSRILLFREINHGQIIVLQMATSLWSSVKKICFNFMLIAEGRRYRALGEMDNVLQ